jgi:hypothetical protein
MVDQKQPILIVPTHENHSRWPAGLSVDVTAKRVESKEFIISNL